MKYAFLLVVALLWLTACDQNNDMVTPETLSIQIDSPTEGWMAHSGANVRIEATISDPVELHTYKVTLINNKTGAKVLEINDHDHSTEVVIDTTVSPTVTAHSDFILTITATNHSGDELTKERKFHLHP